MADQLFPILLVALLVVHVLFVVWLLRSGRLARWDLSLLLGVILMQRTQRGKRFIDAIARPRRFWNLIGDLGIVLTLGGMVAITFFFLWAAWFALQRDSGLPALGVQEIFVIPGINPFVPLWYGIAALIITLIVHEGGHGVLARANGMKLKSLGLLWLVVPIGAFVEPEDLDLKVAKRRARLRVFGAGPAVNLAFAVLAILAFAFMMGSLAPKSGYWVASVVQGEDGEDLPAKAAGLQGGDIVVAADGVPIVEAGDLTSFLNDTRPRQAVTLGLDDGRSVQVTMTSAWDSLSERERAEVAAWSAQGQYHCRLYLDPDPTTPAECMDRLPARPYMGIRQATPEGLAFMAHPFASPINFLFAVQLPLAEVWSQQPILSIYMPSFYDEPFHAATFWVIANLLFWIFWINLMVGITNILPMLPLDGGHIFREAVGGALAKLRPGVAAEQRERVVTVAATVMSLVILAAFLAQLFGPHLFQ